MSPRGQKKFYYKVAQCAAPGYKVEFGPKNILPENQDNEERALLTAILVGQRCGSVTTNVTLIDWFERYEDGLKTWQALVDHRRHQQYQVYVFGECWVV